MDDMDDFKLKFRFKKEEELYKDEKDPMLSKEINIISDQQIANKKAPEISPEPEIFSK